MDNTKYQFWEVPTFYLYYQTQKRHCTCTYLSIYRILWKLKQTESYAFLRGSISYGLNQRRVILGAKRQEFLLTVFYFTRKNNKIKLVILYKQNQDFLYLFALDIILTKYSRWIGKACFFDWLWFSSLFVWFLLNASKSSSLLHYFPYKNSLPSYSAIFKKLQAFLVVGKPIALEVSLCLMLADFSVPRRGIGLLCGNNWLLFHDVHRLYIQIKSRDW